MIDRELLKPKKKTGIVGILNNPATSLNSHSAGWNFILANQLKELLLSEVYFLNEKDDWSKYDNIYVTHGPNYKPGAYNIVGGISQEVLLRSEKLRTWCLDNGNRYKCLDQDFDFNEFLEKRKIESIDNGIKFERDLTDLNCKNELEASFSMYNLFANSLVLGDSHAISVWSPGSIIHRRDGKTLFGFLKENNNLDLRFKKATIYFGNIDIRFHLARQVNPFQAAKDLLCRYLDWADKQNHLEELTLTNLLSIEDESRKLPGSGLYKGEKFFGSRELRQDLVDFFNLLLNDQWGKKPGQKVITWSDSIKDKNGMLSFEAMEPKQSVHLRPKFYQWNAEEIRNNHILKNNK